MRRTKTEADKTRQDLMRSAWQIFSQKGYAETRLSDIARDAGVTRGAIYWHFGNKENLLLSLFKEKADSYFMIISEALEKDLSPLEKIKAILVNIIKKMETDDQFKAEEILMLRRADDKGRFQQIHDYIKQRTKKHSELMFRIIVEGQERGEIRKGIDPRHIVSLFFVFIGGFAKLKLQKGASPFVIPDLQELVDLFLMGIKAD
jgi:TetR/AcrR family acrAB operon transcriptional repressor